MKKIIFIFIVLLQFNVLNAQKPGSNYPDEVKQPEQSNAPKVQEFNPQNVAGILKYDDVKVIKKVKIFKKEKISEIKPLITNYNNEIDDILLTNKHILSIVKAYVEKKVVFAINNKDYSTIKDIHREGQEKLLFIKSQVEEKEASLNSKMIIILSEKQFKKWSTYQKNMKNRLKRI